MKQIPFTLILFSLFLASNLYGQRLTGKASYYADRFDGRPTSTGEIYSKDAFTAASKDFPAGTILRVRNVANNQITQVRVNDCGPNHPERIIDLSRAAAAQIGLLRAGIAVVELEVLAMGTQGPTCNRSRQARGSFSSPTPTQASTSVVTPPSVAPTVTVESDASMPTGSDEVFPLYGIQIAAYGKASNADAFIADNQGKGYGYMFKRTDTKLTRVYVGPYLSRNQAEAQLENLKKKKIKGIVRQVQ